MTDMRRFLSFASTSILISTSAYLACSSSSNAPSSPGNNVDSGTTMNTGAGDSAAPAEESGATGACAPGSGAAVSAKWDFAVSMPSNNGGKGQVLTVHRCDTVTWTNDDNGTSHSVVSTGGGFTFSTPVVVGTAAGAPLSPIQFTTKGTFTYDCGVHGAMMIGQITVN
jgi:plastocyanin